MLTVYYLIRWHVDLLAYPAGSSDELLVLPLIIIIVIVIVIVVVVAIVIVVVVNVVSS